MELDELMTIPRDRLLSLLETMLLMRRAEEKMCELGGDEVHGVYHAYIGQEATGAAVMSQLGPDDAMVSTHRNHGHNLAKGMTPEKLFGELLLRTTGASAGMGGTQHVMSRELKTLATSILGGSTLLATGAALAVQIMEGDWIAVGFLGERPTNEGAVAEALNLASFWQLPVLYVCENNNAVPYEPHSYGTGLGPIADWHRADPILRMTNIVLAEEAATQAEILALDFEVQERVTRAVQTARAAPIPEPRHALQNVRAGGDLWPR